LVWILQKTRLLGLLFFIFFFIFTFYFSFLTTDFISYYSPLVGRRLGGDIIADSNLDWGQGLYRLRNELSGKQVDYIATPSPVSSKWYGLEAERLPPAELLTKEMIAGKTIVISRTLWHTLG